jgi:hypothetical protein
MQSIILEASKTETEEKIKALQLEADGVRKMNERIIAAAKLVDLAKEEAQEIEKQLRLQAKLHATEQAKEKGYENAGAEIQAKNYKRKEYTQVVDIAKTRAMDALKRKYGADINVSNYQTEFNALLAKICLQQLKIQTIPQQ